MANAADGEVRRAAAEAFGHLGEHATPCAPEFAGWLLDYDVDVRTAVVEALRRLGKNAASAEARLRELLDYRDYEVFNAAAAALKWWEY